MPTVAEWRVWMNSTGIPQARAYLAAHPDTEKAIADRARFDKGEQLTQMEFLSMVLHHRPTFDATTPGEIDIRKWRGPSIVDQWKCYKHRLEVEEIYG